MAFWSQVLKNRWTYNLLCWQNRRVRPKIAISLQLNISYDLVLRASKGWVSASKWLECIREYFSIPICICHLIYLYLSVFRRLNMFCSVHVSIRFDSVLTLFLFVFLLRQRRPFNIPSLYIWSDRHTRRRMLSAKCASVKDTHGVRWDSRDLNGCEKRVIDLFHSYL